MNKIKIGESGLIGRKLFNFLSTLIHVVIFGYLLANFHLEKHSALQGHFLFFAEGETGSYYEPMIRLAEEGSYSWKTSIDRYGNEAVMPSTRRTPGLLPLYYPLHRLFGELTAKDLIICIQVLLYLISIFALARSAELLLQEPLAYYGVHIISWLFWFDKPFVFLGIAESLSNSMLIFSLYFAVRLFRGGRFSINAGLFAVFSAWAVMLRPALLLWLVAVALIVALAFLKKQWRWQQVMRFTLVGMMPAFFCVLAWSCRNYSINKTIQPEDDVFLSSPGIYTPSTKSIFQLIKMWGGVVQRWVPNSEGAWLFTNAEVKPRDHYFFSSFDKAYFERIGALYQESRDRQTTDKRLDEIDAEIAEMVTSYIQAYRQEYPLRYHVLNPLRSTALFLHVKTYTYLPFPSVDQMNLLQKIVKLSQVLAVYVLYGLALLSLPFFFLKRVKGTGILLPFVFILLYLLFIGGIMGANEPRYLVPVFPFLTILASAPLARACYLVGYRYSRVRKESVS